MIIKEQKTKFVTSKPANVSAVKDLEDHDATSACLDFTTIPIVCLVTAQQLEVFKMFAIPLENVLVSQTLLENNVHRVQLDTINTQNV